MYSTIAPIPPYGCVNGFRATMLGAEIVISLPQAASALTIDAVDRIARATTALIDGLNPGSGVIVARQGDRYSVPIAKHLVETEDEYTIVAPDGRRYPLNYAAVQPLPGLNLALLEFKSDRADFSGFEYFHSIPRYKCYNLLHNAQASCPSGQNSLLTFTKSSYKAL